MLSQALLTPVTYTSPLRHRVFVLRQKVLRDWFCYFKFYVYGCFACICVYTMYVQYLGRPEEGLRAGVTGGGELPAMWVLGMEPVL